MAHLAQLTKVLTREARNHDCASSLCVSEYRRTVFFFVSSRILTASLARGFWKVVSARRDEVDRRAATGTWGGNLTTMSGSGGVHAGGSRTGPGSQAAFEYSDYKLAPKSETGFAGLSNQGATCYLNSFIQALYMTPEFRKAVFNWRMPEAKYRSSTGVGMRSCVYADALCARVVVASQKQAGAER